MPVMVFLNHAVPRGVNIAHNITPEFANNPDRLMAAINARLWTADGPAPRWITIHAAAEVLAAGAVDERDPSVIALDAWIGPNGIRIPHVVAAAVPVQSGTSLTPSMPD